LCLDSEVEDWRCILLLLNQQIECHVFNFDEVDFSHPNLLNLKEIKPFEKSDIGI